MENKLPKYIQEIVEKFVEEAIREGATSYAEVQEKFYQYLMDEAKEI